MVARLQQQLLINNGILMKKVIVFFNAEPATIVSVMKSISTILREYPNGEAAHLQIMSAGFPSLTGDHQVVYVASDKDLTSDEILATARKLSYSTS